MPHPLLLHLELALLLDRGATPGQWQYRCTLHSLKLSSPGDEVVHHICGPILAGEEEGGAPVDDAADHVPPLGVVILLYPPSQVAG